MRQTGLLSLTLFCGLISGCGLRFEENPKNGPRPPTPGLTAAVRPLGEPFKYRVDVRLPEGLKTQFVEREGETKERVQLSLEKPQDGFSDDQIQSGESYTYRISIQGRPPLILKVDIPKDLVVEGEKRLQELSGPLTSENGTMELRFGRIFFQRNGSLITEGAQLRLILNELHSDFGSIESFDRTLTAEAGRKGRSGGFIEVTVRKAVGNLKVVLRGENGGDGKEPEPRLDPGAEGDPGEDGMYAGGRGPGDPGSCLKHPENGRPGYPGPEGLPGQDGGDGGSSGQLRFQTEESNGFILSFERIPGKRGMGSIGGRGGPGGPGGQPGRHFRVCRRASQGPLGPEGERGPHGLNGQDGQIEPVCLSLKVNQTPQCQ